MKSLSNSILLCHVTRNYVYEEFYFISFIMNWDSNIMLWHEWTSTIILAPCERRLSMLWSNFGYIWKVFSIISTLSLRDLSLRVCLCVSCTEFSFGFFLSMYALKCSYRSWSTVIDHRSVQICNVKILFKKN